MQAEYLRALSDCRNATNPSRVPLQFIATVRWSFNETEEDNHGKTGYQ